MTDPGDDVPERFEMPHDDLYDADGELVEHRDQGDVLEELRQRIVDESTD